MATSEPLIIRELRDEIAQAFDARVIMNEVALTTSTKLSAAMGRWAKEMKRNVSTAREKDLAKVHKKTALLARSAVLSAYEESGIGSGKSYRQNDPGKLRRYSGGAMERAIKNKSFVVGDANGIAFIDKDMMDRTAKQWYRLNFGTLPKGSKNPAVGSMKFFGKASSQRAELTGFGPSRAFGLPDGPGIGFWSSTYAKTSKGPLSASHSGRGAFYVRFRGQKFIGNRPPTSFKTLMSSGIQGKRFLDAGARSINAEYPRLLTGMIRDWEVKAAKALKG